MYRFEHNQERNAYHLVIHFTNHKCMTVYFRRIFTELCSSLSWYHRTYRWNEQPHLMEDIHAIKGNKMLMISTRFSEFGQLPDNYRGSHMVRDPRDLLVSGYRYHKWCKEPWANVPMPPELRKTIRIDQMDIRKDLTGYSYKDLLNYLDQETGLIVELHWRENSFSRMLEWDYQNPAIMELRYENVFGREKETFKDLFHHYGFDESTTESGIKLVERFSFENQERKGKTGDNLHLSKGVAGQWKEYFYPNLKQIFKDKYQPLLVKLDYAKDSSW